MASITRPNSTIRSRGTEAVPKYSHMPPNSKAASSAKATAGNSTESDLGSIVVQRQVRAVN